MADKLIISGEKTKNAIVVSQQKADNKINISGENGSNSLTAINNNAKYYTDKAEGFANKAEQSAIKSANSATQAQESVNTILNNENFISVSENLEVINTIGESIENVNYVGENIESINQLVEDLNNLGDTTNIEIVATNIDSVNTTAENIEAVKTLSGSTGNMETIVNNLTSINYVADNIEDVATVEENKNIVLAQTIIATQQSTIATEQANKASIYSQEAKAFRDETEEIVTNALTDYALKSEIPTYTAGENITIENGVISSTGGSVDLTGYIKNKEIISDVISIGNTTSAISSTTVGSGARSGKYGTALGKNTLASGEYSVAMGNGAEANGNGSTAIGSGSLAVTGSTAIGKAAQVTASNSIQIGQGTNSTANTLQVKNYQLIDLSTGKIPSDRLPEMSIPEEYITEAELEEALKGVGGGLPVGTIIPVTASSSHVPENTLYCGGVEFSGATGQMFRNLWTDYILTGKLDTCSYAEYETDLAIYGQCIKWAVDTANEKFRIPLIKDGAVVQQAGADSIGKSFNAGLPNIEGDYFNISEKRSRVQGSSGALYFSDKSDVYWYNGAASKTDGYGIGFDASKSNSIYGNSDTVQMNAVAVRYFVVVATGSINQSEADWSEFASSLASKANTDLSNVTQSSGLRRLIEISNPGLMPSWYKVFEETNPQTGAVRKWCEQGGRTAVSTSTTTISFLKTFSDTYYSIKMTGTAGYPFINTRTVSSFVADTSSAATVDWEAKGYIN